MTNLAGAALSQHLKGLIFLRGKGYINVSNSDTIKTPLKIKTKTSKRLWMVWP